MRCHELHKQPEGCTQEIPADGVAWRYCPRCGRATGHITYQPPDCKLSVPLQAAKRCQIALRNEGLTPVNVSVQLEAGLEGVRLLSYLTTASVDTRRPHYIELEVPPLEQSEYRLATLLVEVQDAPREVEGDPWDTPPMRPLRLPLSAEVEAPAELRPIEEIALFREGVAERIVTLENRGGTRAEVADVVPPRGYEVVPLQESNRVAGGERLRYKVRRKWHEAAEPESLLVVKTSDGHSYAIELHSALHGDIRSEPQAIIGIDFGTTFSSIAFRECRGHPDQHDDVEFLLPPGESEFRIPSRAWLSLQNELVFGSAADRRYEGLEAESFRFREMKSLLRNPQAAEVDPAYRQEEGIAFARRRFGENWGEALVSEYLRWMYQTCIQPELARRFGTTEADVLYIFSVPVLDFNRDGQPQYERQLASMKRCIARAGFPLYEDAADNRVEFQFEPVCASLGLLHPPRDVVQDRQGTGDRAGKWPVLGSPGYPVQEGDRIAVYDSGGGTTDVVLARVGMDEKGTISLAIEQCLGVDSKAQTFGGEWVTDRVFEALLNPATVVDDRGHPRPSRG